jgi:putative oxidoreductase
VPGDRQEGLQIVPGQVSAVDYGALLLRVSMGLMFIVHGAIKLFVFTPLGTARFFESFGLPAPLAYLSIAAELGGGVLLVLGAWSRVVSVALIPFLLGALFTAHVGHGLMFSAPGGGWEFPAFWTVALAVQALIGDGAFAARPWSPRRG